MSTSKTESTEIPVPSILVGQEIKVEAFKAGWQCGTMDRVSIPREVKERIGLSAEDFIFHQDLRNNNLVANAFCWGYFARQANLREEKNRTVSYAEADHSSHLPDTVEVHVRMERNPSFIPNWAWGFDDEDLSDTR